LTRLLKEYSSGTYLYGVEQYIFGGCQINNILWTRET
jgi:hypothetical protein